MGAELMLEAIGFFLVFLFLGMPVAFAIAISGAIFFILTPEIPWTILVQKSLSTTQSFTMLAIPLFIFAGNLMNNTGITSRLVKLANVLTGHMYGSIGQVSVVLSTLMGGVSGSAVADAAMECRILGPEMTKRGYAPGWAAAVNCLTGLIVATIPPSMGLIIYGTVGEVSIGRLFVAGFVPGIIMCIFMLIATGPRQALSAQRDTQGLLGKHLGAALPVHTDSAHTLRHHDPVGVRRVRYLLRLHHRSLRL